MAADPTRARRVTRSMVALFLAIPLVIAVAAAWVARSLLARAACSNQVRTERIAPDGAHLAVVFVRTCGDRAPASTHVSVLPAGHPLPDGGGNLLELEGEHGVGTEWRAADELTVSVRRGTPIARSGDEAYGIHATLEEL
jgi:hypothetical protein